MAVHSSREVFHGEVVAPKGLNSVLTAGAFYDVNPFLVDTYFNANTPAVEAAPISKVAGVSHHNTSLLPDEYPLLIGTSPTVRNAVVSADEGVSWITAQAVQSPNGASYDVPIVGQATFGTQIEALLGFNTVIIALSGLRTIYNASPTIVSAEWDAADNIPDLVGVPSNEHAIQVAFDKTNDFWWVAGRRASANELRVGYRPVGGNPITDNIAFTMTTQVAGTACRHIEIGPGPSGLTSVVFTTRAQTGRYFMVADGSFPATPVEINISAFFNTTVGAVLYNEVWNKWAIFPAAFDGSPGYVALVDPAHLGSTTASDYEIFTPTAHPGGYNTTFGMQTAGGSLGTVGPWCYMSNIIGGVSATPDMGRTWYIQNKSHRFTGANRSLLTVVGTDQKRLFMGTTSATATGALVAKTGVMAVPTPFML